MIVICEVLLLTMSGVRDNVIYINTIGLLSKFDCTGDEDTLQSDN